MNDQPQLNAHWLDDQILTTKRSAMVFQEANKLLEIMWREVTDELFSCPDSDKYEFTFTLAIPADCIGLVLKALENAGRKPKYHPEDRKVSILLPEIKSECPDMISLNEQATSKVQPL